MEHIENIEKVEHAENVEHIENVENKWDKPLYRLFLITVAASSILGIGVLIGRATANSGKLSNELSIILNYIEQQNNTIDSLNRLTSNTVVDEKYFVLNDYEENLKIKCFRDGKYLEPV